MTTPTTQLYGNSRDIPPELSKLLPKNSIVLYWSLPDPDQPLCQGIFCERARPLLVLPCFWPHLVLLGLPMACAANCTKKTVLRQGVVVTTSTVEFIQMDYDVCCIPGIYTVSGTSRSIPLGSISSLDINKKDSGCLTCCFPDYTKVVLNDGAVAPSGNRQEFARGTPIYGHTNIEALRQQVIDAQQNIGPNASMMSQAVNIAMTQLMQQQGMMMQPGMMQPGMMQPGMMQPGMMQPGMMQPGMMQPGMMQPGMMQPGMMQPGMMQPGMMQPGMMQPGMMQPVMIQAGAVVQHDAMSTQKV
jgi:hypothetical protein